MNKELFYVEVKLPHKKLAYVFSRSLTGMLDYAGAAEAHEIPQADEHGVYAGFQKVEASNYFSCSWYTFLPKDLQAEISVLIPDDVNDLDTNHYSFLLHVGALLMAVEQGDPLLVAELLHRRPYVFSAFTPIVLHIVKPVAAEALFAWTYGRMNGNESFANTYQGNSPISTGEEDVGVILFHAAKSALKPNPAAETPKAMFIRYFKERFEEKIPTTLTIGLVGANNHKWVDGFKDLDNAVTDALGAGFMVDASAVGGRKQQFLESLAITMQAETYNPHDHNAIVVNIDDISAKLKGVGGKSKAGYIRAIGAAILRKALPGQLSYSARLWRVGATPDWFENAIVLKVKIY